MKKILVQVSMKDFSTVTVDSNGTKWISVERVLVEKFYKNSTV